MRHFGENPYGESSSSGVNQVKLDNVWSRGRSVGRRHCIFSLFEHFDSAITSGYKFFAL